MILWWSLWAIHEIKLVNLKDDCYPLSLTTNKFFKNDQNRTVYAYRYDDKYFYIFDREQKKVIARVNHKCIGFFHDDFDLEVKPNYFTSTYKKKENIYIELNPQIRYGLMDRYPYGAISLQMFTKISSLLIGPALLVNSVRWEQYIWSSLLTGLSCRYPLWNNERGQVYGGLNIFYSLYDYVEPYLLSSLKNALLIEINSTAQISLNGYNLAVGLNLGMVSNYHGFLNTVSLLVNYIFIL